MSEVTIQGVPISKLTKAYIKIRDKKTEIKTAFEEQYDSLTEQQDKIKRALLDYCKENDFDSVKTPVGTISRRTRTRYWTSDWEAMGKFIIEHEAPDLLQKTIHQSNMAEFLEQNPDVAPPGLNVDSEYTLSVRKPTRKS